MKKFSQYINESTNITTTINEGIWDFLKSLFSTEGQKKYKKAYDDFVKENDDIKKKQEEQQKLEQSFSSSKDDLLNKLKDTTDPEERKKVLDSLDELFKNYYQKSSTNQEQIQQAIENSSSPNKQEAGDSIHISWLQKFLTDTEPFLRTLINGLTQDTDKNTQQRVISYVNTGFEQANKSYSLLSDDAKKLVKPALEKAKLDKFIGTDVKFDIKEYYKFASSNKKPDNNTNQNKSTNNKKDDKFASFKKDGGFKVSKNNKEAEKEITEKTTNVVKDKVDILNGIIKATGTKIDSTQLVNFVSNLIYNAKTEDNIVDVTEDTIIGTSTMLLGLGMVLKSDAKKNFKTNLLHNMSSWFKNVDVDNWMKNF